MRIPFCTRARSWGEIRTAVELLIFTAALAIPFRGQMASGGQGAGAMEEKVAALKQSIVDNQERLHQYQWMETTQLTLKGEAKPPKQNMCSYGPDGKVQKVAMGDSQPQQEQSGRRGRLKEHVVKKKTEEMQDYMQQVKGLLALYVPPSSERIQAARQAGNISLAPTGSDVVRLIFKNYAQPGDQMTLSFNTAAKKTQQLNVNTYLNDPKDAVTLTVQFASLPDGTNYPQQTMLDAPAKKIQVTTTNSNYQKLAQ
jgi:hypothetical protein